MTRPPIFLNGRYLTQPVTGVQRHAQELVRALDRRLGETASLSMTLLVPPGARAEALQHIRVRRAGWWGGHAWEQTTLAWRARRGVLLGFANTGPVAHARHLVTIHDASVFSVPNAYTPTFRRWYRWLLPQLVRRARLVATDSAFSRDELVRWIGADPERTRVVPLGTEHILATPPDTGILQRLQLSGRPFLLAAGSARPHKNLALVVQAVQRLGAAAPPLVVVGAPNPRIFGGTALPGVITPGFVSDAALRALYEAAALFVFPSLYEGFGLPPLEAMRCGCAVIAARAGSLPEVCGAGAQYVDPSDPADLARAIAALLDNASERLSLAARGRVHAETFTWARAADATLAMIDEIGTD